MSMYTRISAYKPPTDDYMRMKAVWDACIAAYVEIPKQVEEYFNWVEPTAYGERIILVQGTHYEELHDDMHIHYDIKLSNLPKGVETIRVTNGW